MDDRKSKIGRGEQNKELKTLLFAQRMFDFKRQKRAKAPLEDELKKANT